MSFEISVAGDRALLPAPGDLAEARRQLEEAPLVGDDQEWLRSQVLDFTGRHPDSLHRSCVPGHLTGSAAVVDPVNSKTLLIHHAKLRRWLQPGGHADGDGNLAAVAWREAAEETGLVGLRLVTPAIDVDVHTIPARPGEPEHLHLDLRFLVLASAEEAPVSNHEVVDARWLDHDDPLVTAGGELTRLLTRAGTVARSLR